MSLPDFCKSTVPPGANEELIKLYACKDASNCFLDVQQKNNQITLYNETQNKKLEDALNLYKQNIRAYEAKKANKRKELVDEMKVWNSCVLWTGVYGHDDWCQGDTGFGMQTGAGQYGCALGQGKGECKRTTTQVEEELNKWIGENPSPIMPTRNDFSLLPPIPLDDINIQCCSNYLSGNATVTGNEQVCSQSVEKKIIELTGAPSSTVPAPVQATTPNVPSNTNVFSLTDNTLLLILIILVILGSSTFLLFI